MAIENKSAYARLRPSSSGIEVRFERVGPGIVFDRFLDSFRASVPGTRFNRETRWQVVPFDELGNLINFCQRNLLPENIIWQIEGTTESTWSQLLLPL